MGKATTEKPEIGDLLAKEISALSSESDDDDDMFGLGGRDEEEDTDYTPPSGDEDTEDAGEESEEEEVSESADAESEAETAEGGEDDQDQEAVSQAETQSSEDQLLQTLRQQNEFLLSQVQQMQAAQSQAAAAQQPKNEALEEPPTQSFVSEEGFEAALRDPQAFNKLLSAVYHKARAETIQEIRSEMPQVVGRYVTTIVDTRSLVEDFYKVNPDLAKHKDLVGLLATQLTQRQPGLADNIPALLQQVEPIARKVLGREKGRVAETKSPKNPTLARPSKRKPKPKPKVIGTEAEIAELGMELPEFI